MSREYVCLPRQTRWERMRAACGYDSLCRSISRLVHRLRLLFVSKHIDVPRLPTVQSCEDSMDLFSGLGQLSTRSWCSIEQLKTYLLDLPVVHPREAYRALSTQGHEIWKGDLDAVVASLVQVALCTHGAYRGPVKPEVITLRVWVREANDLGAASGQHFEGHCMGFYPSEKQWSNVVFRIAKKEYLVYSPWVS